MTASGRVKLKSKNVYKLRLQMLTCANDQKSLLMQTVLKNQTKYLQHPLKVFFLVDAVGVGMDSYFTVCVMVSSAAGPARSHSSTVAFSN